MFVRRPGDGLDCGCVLAELGLRRGRIVGAPNEQLVVVAAGSQLLVIEAPLEAADFLAMANEASKIVARTSDVPMEDASVSASRGQEAAVPGDGTNPAFMAFERLDDLAFDRVPNLELAHVRAYC